MRHLLAACLAATLLSAVAGRSAFASVTDEDVRRAIERAKEYLINTQQADGSWPEQTYHEGITGGHTALAMQTLLYIGVHPNREVITKGLEAMLRAEPKYTYVTSTRIIALSIAHGKVIGEKRTQIRQALLRDVAWLIKAQGQDGGWDYLEEHTKGTRYDLSNTQMAILALREAALAGVEIPPYVWQRSLQLYFDQQHQDDGGWNYGAHNKEIGQSTPSYGAMTAAGLASIYICWDNLTLGEGCPCSGGHSTRTESGVQRRIDLALAWLDANFSVTGNPNAPNTVAGHNKYWLYSAERVGIAAGYKYFGRHDWFKEGAEYLVRTQGGGGWGGIADTCFATIFLYKGRAPLLYNKLEHRGQWNNHRRDIANLTHYIERKKEEMFLWQIVNLQGSVEELHDAPILYITAETPPDFNDDEKKKLREFTDTGGTILFEASCGNATVRAWFKTFAKEVWPEWNLAPLGSKHGVFLDPHRLERRPELFGLNDGLRTFLFYAMDDISCPWHTKAFTGRAYLFDWGINLFTYATDRSPLRARLAPREAGAADRYTGAIRGGPKRTVRLARLQYEGDWIVGRQYKGFDRIREMLQKKTGVMLEVNEAGVAPSGLTPGDVVYLAGSNEKVSLAPAEREALRAHLAGDGFLWAEAAGGSAAFDQAFHQLAADMGWRLELLPMTDPLLTGSLSGATAYDLRSGVKFRRTLRIARLSRDYAELVGIYDGQRLVGIYSPFDIVFSATAYNAYASCGYFPEDARAVAANIVLYLTSR